MRCLYIQNLNTYIKKTAFPKCKFNINSSTRKENNINSSLHDCTRLLSRSEFWFSSFCCYCCCYFSSPCIVYFSSFLLVCVVFRQYIRMHNINIIRFDKRLVTHFHFHHHLHPTRWTHATAKENKLVRSFLYTLYCAHFFRATLYMGLYSNVFFFSCVCMHWMCLLWPQLPFVTAIHSLFSLCVIQQLSMLLSCACEAFCVLSVESFCIFHLHAYFEGIFS